MMPRMALHVPIHEPREEDVEAAEKPRARETHFVARNRHEARKIRAQIRAAEKELARRKRKRGE